MAADQAPRSEHWQRVHQTRSPEEVSWTQARPERSLALIEALGVPKDARVLDVGGGISNLVDHLLDRGHSDLHVLDISSEALDHTRRRLGSRAGAVRFWVGDVLEAALPEAVALWHDRAVFHFLTEANDRARYAARLRSHLAPGGAVVMATFAADGPERCSGLPTMRYDADALHRELGLDELERLDACTETHITPQGREQRFQYLALRRR